MLYQILKSVYICVMYRTIRDSIEHRTEFPTCSILIYEYKYCLVILGKIRSLQDTIMLS